MLTHPTHERLITLGLTGMAKALQEQRRSPDLERQGIEIRRSSLLLQSFGHSGQAERDQPFMGGVRQH